MASVNIDNGAMSDPRFAILGKKLGTTKFDAMGRMSFVWAYCTDKQTHFLSEEIINTIAEHENFSELASSTEVGLLEKHDGYFRIKGTKGRIEWLKRLRKQSKKGGDSTRARWQAKRLAKTGPTPRPKEGPITITTTIPITTTQIQEKNTTCMGELTLAPSPPLPVPKKSRFDDETRNKMRSFIATYSSFYREKYGGPPEGIRQPEIVGKIGNWIKTVSEERANQLAQIYLQIDYRPISESCHDLWQFFRHLNRIGNALATGKDPNQINWASVFGGAA